MKLRRAKNMCHFWATLYNTERTLHQLLPDRRHNISYSLRPRRHDLTLSRGSHCILDSNFIVRQLFKRERERVYLPQHKEQTYKNILNKSTVAGYQKGKPIKLVAYSTNYIGS